MESQAHAVQRQIGEFDVSANWQQILQLLPAGAYTCDAAGLITYFSPRAEALWGRTPKLRDPEYRYCGSLKMYSTAGAPIHHDACWMALALADGKPYNGRDLVIERPDGSRVSSRVYANPFRNEQGQITGTVNLILEARAHNDAALAMMEVAVSVFTLMSWPTSAVH